MQQHFSINIDNNSFKKVFVWSIVKFTYMGMNVIVTLEKELFQEIIESPKRDYCRAYCLYIYMHFEKELGAQVWIYFRTFIALIVLTTRTTNGGI